MAIALSMILLRNDSPIRAEDCRKHLGRLLNDESAITDLREDDENVSAQVGEANVIWARMPAPFPWSDLEGPCATSLLWNNAESEVKGHKIHWIVTVQGDLDPMAMSSLLTTATAAGLAACDTAIGVYWGNATLLIPKQMFIDFATEVLPHEPPLPIWVDCRAGKDSDQSSSAFTTGMKALGHMELEAQGSPESPGELRKRLMAIAAYLIDNGPVIKNGDTIGQDAAERIRIVHSDSSFGHDGKVMRLVYEKALQERPWWKFW